MIIFPNDRKDIALTRNEAGIINRARLACYLTAQRAEIGHLAAAPKKPMNKRADRAIADDVAQIVDPIGFAVVQRNTLTQEAEIDGLRVLVWPQGSMGVEIGLPSLPAPASWPRLLMPWALV